MSYFWALLFAGSPPPTRGTLKDAAGEELEFGITPAYAGNTYYFIIAFSSNRDHPRLRGEHLHIFSAFFYYSGSPPPTRGTLENGEISEGEYRITPAYAGNTECRHRQELYEKDHPRLRGEHTVKLPNWANRIGSPPPTRGTHF